MTNKAYLILEDGTVFKGLSFGAKGEVTGEVVFTTSMTGYLETLTDQSYYGQIILQTFPLIGNYGVIPSDFESSSIKARAYIVKEPCQEPSNFRSEGNLDTFLKEQGIIGLCDIDTRALTKVIREKGVMNGKITSYPPTDCDLDEVRAYCIKGAISAVSSSTVTKSQISSSPAKRKIAMLDFGVKGGIIEALKARDCEVYSFPHDHSSKEILKIHPDGIVLSNGPGDPADPSNAGIVNTIQELIHSGIPMFGICLGHQLLAIANGFKTHKLKFGHRGANQPVKDLSTGRVYITSQNHGYAVDSSEFNNAMSKISFINVNDGTCEGIDYGVSFSVQFHPEARSGPLDTDFLFERFIERIDDYDCK